MLPHVETVQVPHRIDDNSELTTRWGVVDGPPRWDSKTNDWRDLNPVFMVLPDIVAACLSPQGWVSDDGIRAFANRDGRLVIQPPGDADKQIYELHPAIFSDTDDSRLYLAVAKREPTQSEVDDG